jgi:hypothetical protein
VTLDSFNLESEAALATVCPEFPELKSCVEDNAIVHGQESKAAWCRGDSPALKSLFDLSTSVTFPLQPQLDPSPQAIEPGYCESHLCLYILKLDTPGCTCKHA